MTHHHWIEERPPSDFLIDFDQVPMAKFSFHAGSICKMRSRSVFEWDAGLWLACKESNFVINRHFHPQQWMRRGRKLLPDGTIPNRSQCFSVLRSVRDTWVAEENISSLYVPKNGDGKAVVT